MELGVIAPGLDSDKTCSMNPPRLPVARYGLALTDFRLLRRVYDFNASMARLAARRSAV